VAKQEREAMPQTFQMDRQCTLREAEALKLALDAAEDSSGDLVVDASAVDRVDTAGLQLLIAFAARLKLIERQLVWQGVSPALRAGARQLGLVEALGLPEAP
jgi:anti-anti-sigma regulatory factor